MFRIKIGPFVTAINLKPSSKEREIKGYLKGFLTDDEEDMRLNVRFIHNLRFANYKGPAPAEKVSSNLFRLKWYYFSGQFDIKSGVAEVDACDMPFIISSILRMLYAIKASFESGIFVHAASFVKEDRAYLFPGKSGSGKSTLSRIAINRGKNITPLSDEISYISYEAKEAYAYSTPFWGNTRIMGTYIKSPLCGIYFIKKARINTKKPIDCDEALKLLLENILFASMDSDSFGRTIMTARRILRQIRSNILYFTKDERFLEVI